MPYALPANWKTRHVAVIGGGTLGRRIAAVFMSGGTHVKLVARRPAQREDVAAFATQTLPEFDARLAKRGLPHGTRGKLETVATPEEAVPGAWLVIESIAEDLEVKRALFASLEVLADADALLATNSSSYASRLIAANMKRREQVFNLHFTMPPEFMVVELMSCGATAEGLLPAFAETARRYGLLPFIARQESTGFIFNRIWAAIKRESLAVVAEKVSTPEDVDGIMTSMFGIPPFKLMDQVGLDVILAIEDHYAQENPHLPAGPRTLLHRYVDAGKCGRKTGEGFYTYKD